MKIFNKIPRGITCLVIIVALFGYMGSVIGVPNMINTMMRTAHDLLLNTVFYLMGMCVLTGALSKVLVNFGVVDLLQRLLRPVMKPLFNMPGRSLADCSDDFPQRQSRHHRADQG